MLTGMILLVGGASLVCLLFFFTLIITNTVYIFTQNVFIHIYPTPPLWQDMTQGQFLSGVWQVWIQSFSFS